MTKNISTNADITRIRLIQQTSHPSAPTGTYDYLYVTTGSFGGLFIMQSNGIPIGPFITGSSGGGSTPPATVTPTSISGCINWIDLNQETGSEGDPISTLTDRSTSANNATQTLTLRPTLRLQVANGKKGAYFDGVNDFMQFGSNIDLAAGYTIILVIIPSYFGTYSPIFTYKQQGIYQYIAGAGYWGIYRSGAENVGYLGGGRPQIIGLWGSSNTAYDLIYNQARILGTNTNGYSAFASSKLGGDNLSGGQLFKGYLLESIVFNTKILQADLYNLITWLQYKWTGYIAQ